MDIRDPSLVKEQCLIGGEWVGTPVSEVRNPATGKVLARVPDLGRTETKAAIEAAAV